jgi:hypothetical protein
VKTILASLFIAAVAITLMPSEASAWVCYARGDTGATGWGSHPYSLSYARRRALAECAVRTPRGSMCYLTGCR